MIVRRRKVLKATRNVFMLAFVSLGTVWLFGHSDAVLARWASISTIIALLLSVWTSWMQRSVSEPAEKADASKVRQVIVGDIPQESKAFEKRIELFKKMTAHSSKLRIHSIVGRRGAGKSQLAGEVARKRIAQHWCVIIWINAENEAYLLAGFRQAAIRLGLDRNDLSGKDLAMSVRHWLEADGETCILVFDNAVSGSVVRQYMPTVGKAQIIVTTDDQELASLGIPLSVEQFTPDQAIAYMRSRTG
jgi:hypothetical protein